MKSSISKKKAVAGAVAVLLVVAAIAVIVSVLNRSTDDDTAPTGPGGAQLNQYPVPDAAELDTVGSKAKQTTVTSCDALDEGGWQAMGTVENTGDKDRDYDITVFFMRGDEPVNFAQTKVTAPADGTVPWVVEKVFGTDDNLACKLVAVS